MTDEIKQAVPEELPWQRELREVRQLLRNVVVNHDRIRDRVRSLHDHFDEGNINTGISNWEEWASDYFAYSPTFLKYISSPHPLSLDEWEKKIAKTQEIEIEIQKKQDAARAQTAWDEWVQYEKEQAAQRKLESDKEIAEKKIEAARVKVAADIEAARIKADGEKEVARIRTKATRQKQKQSAKSKPQPDLTTVPPVEAAQAHLNNCIQIERKSRIDLGREYAALKELADKRLLGKNPRGKPWLFKPFCDAYIARSYRDVNRCIEEYNQSMVESGTSCPMSQSENVVPLVRS